MIYDLLQLLLVLTVYGAGATVASVAVVAGWMKWGPRA